MLIYGENDTLLVAIRYNVKSIKTRSQQYSWNHKEPTDKPGGITSCRLL